MCLKVQSSVSPHFLSVLFCFVFEHEAIYTIRVFTMLSFIDLCQITISLSVKTFKSLTVHFSFGLCSRHTNVNYRAWHVYKPLFSSSVATGSLACSEISLSINKKKKLEWRPENGRILYKLADGVTVLAKLCVLYSDKTHVQQTNDSARYIRTL